MSAQSIRIVEALRLRVQQILTAGGYFTNAGQNTFLGRTQFDRETDAYPLITFGVPQTDFDALNTRTQNYTKTADFLAIGYIAVATDDYASNPAALQADMERALCTAAPGDLLLPLVENFRLMRAAIEYAQQPTDFTRVSVQLRATWTEQLGATFP